MAVEVYLGYPSPNIIAWIQAHSQPAGHSDTRVTYIAESGYADWSGEIVGELSSGSIPNKEYIETVDVGTSVTSFSYDAFYCCSNLKMAIIPNSVTIIGGSSGFGGGAFSNCSGLTSITIPNSVTSIGDWAFSYCSGLTSIMIPNSVTSIGEYAFGYCSGLTSITIPNSVTSIGDGVIYGCSGLTNVTIPDSVTSIGYFAFSDCSSLENVTFEGKDRATVQSMTSYPFGLN